MAVPQAERLSPAEYLERERTAETRSEYHDGLVVAMVGGTPAHVIIATNIASELRAQVKGRRCTTYTQAQRIRLPRVNRYVYPDVVVVCGPPQYEDSVLK